jgi:hypothetical protein
MQQRLSRDHRKISLVSPFLEVTSTVNEVAEANGNGQRTSMKPATPSVLDICVAGAVGMP